MTITEAGYSPRRWHTDSTFDLIARALERRRRDGRRPDHDPQLRQPARQRRRRPRRPLLGAAAAGAAALADWIESTLHVPELDGRPHHAGDLGRRPRRLARLGSASSTAGRSSPSRSASGSSRTTSSAGRPRWEDVGVLFTDDVHDWELYKLRILNAGHSCMAYLVRARRHHVRRRGDGDPGRPRLRRAACCTTRPCRRWPRSPDTRVPSTRQRCSTRFANPGVRDQIARLCIDGTAKFPTFLIPTIERHLETGGPIASCRTRPRRMGPLSGDRSRRAAGVRRVRRRRLAVMPATRSTTRSGSSTSTPCSLAALRDSERFRDEFVAACRDAWRRPARLAAMAALGGVG